MSTADDDAAREQLLSHLFEIAKRQDAAGIMRSVMCCLLCTKEVIVDRVKGGKLSKEKQLKWRACIKHLISNKDHFEGEHAAVLAVITGDDSVFKFSPSCPLLGKAPRNGPLDMHTMQALAALYLSPVLDYYLAT